MGPILLTAAWSIGRGSGSWSGSGSKQARNATRVAMAIGTQGASPAAGVLARRPSFAGNLAL